MQEIKLYDPDRNPANWMEIIQPGQYAIFHMNPKSCEECTADGRRIAENEVSTCLIFDDLESAQAYANKKIIDMPHVSCELYDHHGKGRDPIQVFVNDAQRTFYAGTSKYQNDIFWGAIFLPSGITIFFLLSWLEGWVYAFAPIIASKFVIIGLIRLFGGLSKWHSSKKTISF